MSRMRSRVEIAKHDAFILASEITSLARELRAASASRDRGSAQNSHHAVR